MPASLGKRSPERLARSGRARARGRQRGEPEHVIGVPWWRPWRGPAAPAAARSARSTVQRQHRSTGAHAVHARRSSVAEPSSEASPHRCKAFVLARATAAGAIAAGEPRQVPPAARPTAAGVTSGAGSRASRSRNSELGQRTQRLRPGPCALDRASRANSRCASARPSARARPETELCVEPPGARRQPSSLPLPSWYGSMLNERVPQPCASAASSRAKVCGRLAAAKRFRRC